MAYEEIRIKSETGRCLLCHDAPCSKVCPQKIDVADAIRSLRFENPAGADKILSEHPDSCRSCEELSCRKVCNRRKIDRPLDIPGIFSDFTFALKAESGPVDLSTQLCGVPCENPFFLSSSVVGSNYEMVAKAFEMGWAGVAFKTIGAFVPEEISPRFDRLEKESNPMIGFKNIEQISDHTLDENLLFLKQLKKDYPSKVIVASIMGRDEEEWTKLAGLTEKAGADVIECNFSCPHMSGEGMGSDIGTNPELVARYTAAVKRGTKLPVLAKMTPNITNMEPAALAAAEAGADGIAAINTVKSIMNVNLHTFASGPDVEGKSTVGGYSGKAVKPIALRFLYDMKTNQRLKELPVSGMGGIETWRDAAEFIALGCETVQITTAVMQYGYRIIDDLISGLSGYMREEKIESVQELTGRALENILPAEELNRQTIEYPKFDRDKCVSCGRCYISCYDGGHQAIRMEERTKKPILNGKKCVGCQLCLTVCPAQAIRPGIRTGKKKKNS